MVSLLEPRNETEFIKELKFWFCNQYPDRAYFVRTVGTSGMPDIKFGMRLPDGTKRMFHAEAKYVPRPARSLRHVWDLLRGSQKYTMPKMAAAGFPTYVVVCIAGIEADWYFLDPDVSHRVVQGKAPPWTCMYLKYQSVRNPLGKWTMKDSGDTKGFKVWES